MARRSATRGTGGSTTGRCSTRPSALVNSRLVTGAGPVRLTGPAIPSVPSTCRIAPTSSASEIQDHHCRPEPSGAASPSRASGRSRPSSPPLPQTSPLRRWATRTPASSAARVAASQRRQTCARKSYPAGSDSSTGASPVSPYQPIADADSSARGRGSRAVTAAMAALSVSVASTRLASTARLRAAVQRRSPMPTPARLTTASTPASAAGSSVPAAGSQRSSSGPAGGRRTSRSTVWPSSRSVGSRAEPISPEDPVTAIFTDPILPGRGGARDRRRSRAPDALLSAQPELGLERAGLQPLLHGDQEAGRVRTVDQPVVVGQGQGDHRPDRDDLAEVWVVDHDRPLHDRAGAEDADLRLVDDRRVEQGTAAAGVGQRERAAAELVRADLVDPGALREVGDLAGHAAEVEVAGVVDDRHQQPALGVHRDAEVLGVVVGDRPRLGVDGRVDVRVLLERLDRGDREDGQARQLHALPPL